MANTKKTGFRTVSRQEKKDYQRQLKEHRMQVLRRTVIATVAIFLFLGGTVLYMSLRQYTDYDVRVSVERSDTKATRFEEFQGNILKYSNDGALYTAHDNELLWTQTYEMANPTIDMCGNYLTIYDKKGKDIYILNKGGFVHSIKTNYPISHVSVAGQGTVAVLMENQSAGLLMLYDKEGNELVSGAIHGEKGGYPLAIALSDDGIKLGVSMLDVSEGSVKTSLAFYNFGSVGESAIDHMVSITGYEDVLMPELNFLSKDCMIAVSDGGIFVFEGAQSPKEVTKIQPAEQIKSVFYNEEYIGFVYRQNG